MVYNVKTLGSRLKKILKDKNLTQKDAAEIVGISAQSLNYIITNDLKTSKLAPKIAMKLGIHSDWLLYGKGRPMEPVFFEVPIVNNTFALEKFIQQEDTLDNISDFAVIDYDLGPNAFAYLLNKRELVFCHPYESNITSNLFLCINFSDNIVELKEEKSSENSFSVYAILKKYSEG